MRPYKPDNYPALSPYLLLSDARKSLDFAQTAFDGEVLRVTEGERGIIGHAELRVFGGVVMMGETKDAQGGHVHVYVPDLDTSYDRAMAAGGRSIQAPRKGDDPDRRCGVGDPGGITWWLATMIDFD